MSPESVTATNQAVELVGQPIEQCTLPLARALLQLGIHSRFENEISMRIPNLGIEACVVEGHIVTVFLHAQGHEEFDGFPFSFRDVDFSSPRTKVHEALGKPTKSGGESDSNTLGSSGSWDIYYIGGREFHFSYSIGGNSIVMATVS